jgi:hypothetical protein
MRGKQRVPGVACRRGHEWKEGSYWLWRGYKHCKICRRERYWKTYRVKNLERHERDRQEMRESLKSMKRFRAA